ncbi:MAG TPA: polysaccharide deacetylase family protein [Candidatus Fimousia stercorigallinarum]|nr:polysaccharide deacetylase family protein [Candidatus Fimousia stercorigallinarum]
MNKEEQASTQAQTEAETETTAPTANDSADAAALSNEKKGWWIKRKENNEQSEAQNEIDLAKYDAFYVDTKNKDKKVMYLTFDCGYDNGYTEPMLDILKKHKAYAIFFVTQTYIRDNVEIVKRMKKEGHLVGNHTVKHKSMPDLSERDIKEELITCADYCKEATGYEMDPYVRPPMGEYSERTLQICKNLGYKTVFWSMAYLDYEVDNQPGSDFVIDHFEKYYHNGAIPLLHNVSKSNAEALDTVLTNLEKKGFTFENVDKIEIE